MDHREDLILIGLYTGDLGSLKPLRPPSMEKFRMETTRMISMLFWLLILMFLLIRFSTSEVEGPESDFPLDVDNVTLSLNLIDQLAKGPTS